MTRSLVLLLSLSLLATLSAQQDARGTVSGQVTDVTGANVAGAEVRVTNVATGVAIAIKTNESGNYTVPFLVPATYTVVVESAGFRKFQRENVQIRVGDVVTVDVQMTVGDVNETVNVTAETPLLQTAEASLGQVVDERRILELPLFSGNAMEFALLAPGTVNGTDMRLRKAAFNNAPSQFSTDGSGLFNNEFNIDGVVNTFSDGTNVRVAFSPPQASLGEFKVQTSVFDASLGHTTGSVVNISTKGGTNDIHGSAWWWLRHSKLDTPTIYQNRANQKLPIYQDNRYGLSGGGPVMLPKLYNGKNKTFWYWTWEANKFGDPNVGATQSTVPREAWRNGDFSDLLRLGTNYQLYDPATIQANANGTFSRQPFPDNIIPPSRISPIARNILALYPLPNQPGAANGAQNYLFSGKAIEDYWATIGRVDHVFSEKDRVFIRLHRDYWEEDKNRAFGNDVNGIILNRINRGIALDEVHMFTPTFLLNFRYGLTQQIFPERRTSQGFDLSSLGFSPQFVSLFPRESAVPNVQLGSLTSLSPSEGGDGAASSLVHSFVGNFTNIRGKHTLKFGPEFRLYRVFSNRFSASTSPVLNFSSEWGRGPLNTSPAPPVGAELVSLLLGIPGGNAQRTGSFATQDKYWAGYFQDDWKLTQKLTMNLGLRVEYESPVTERFDRSVTQFDPTTPNPVAGAAIANYGRNPIPELPVSSFRVLGGPLFANTAGNSRDFWNSTGLMLLPRIGIAYQLNPKTVLRTGYGIFYGSLGSFRTTANLSGFTQSTIIQPTVDNGLTFQSTLANPLPDGLLPVAAAAGGLRTNLNQNLTVFPKDRKMPYAQRWSIGLQREFPAGFVLESSYVGNRGTRLPVLRNLNALPAEYLSTAPTRDTARINFLNANSPNPFFGLDPQFNSGTISRQQLLRPYPQFGNILYNDPVGYSWYHSLQSRLEKRFGQGFTLQISHTWSRAMEASSFLNGPANTTSTAITAQDAMPYESLSDIDRTQRVAGSGIWELPFGRGRRFGANMNRYTNMMLGGWQLSGAYQRQSGQPINWGNIQITGDPNQLNLPSDARNTDRWFNTSIFNTSSTQVLASNIRTFPFRFSNARFDQQRRLDFSLNKTFPIGERVRMRFRGDVFNVQNTPVLRGPNADPINGAFGRITAQEPPRSFQFSLNLQF
ncbi:MAG: carboxypeptidase regulatory-like domain-containing protein [Bryobacteraceae bacterium]|nr:carboxypeptidase regulatory-like domain-containing protein [Bryobacteraceae bacterium]